MNQETLKKKIKSIRLSSQWLLNHEYEESKEHELAYIVKTAEKIEKELKKTKLVNVKNLIYRNKELIELVDKAILKTINMIKRELGDE